MYSYFLLLFVLLKCRKQPKKEGDYEKSGIGISGMGLMASIPLSDI